MNHVFAKAALSAAAMTMLLGQAFALDFDEYICTEATDDPSKLPNQYGPVIDGGIMGDDVGYMVDTNDDGTVDVFVIDRGGDGDTFEEIAYYPAGKSAVRVVSMNDKRCKNSNKEAKSKKEPSGLFTRWLLRS